MDVSADNVAITWEERRPPSAATQHSEIFFVGSNDAAATFSQPISTSSSLGDLDSILNDVTISGNKVYSVWTVFENNNFKIYFAAGTITTTTVP